MSKHSARGKDWEAQRLRVLARDGWTCTACYKALEGQDATVDHVNPISLSDGRDYEDHELTSMCRTCNARKSNQVISRLDYRNPRWFS